MCAPAPALTGASFNEVTMSPAAAARRFARTIETAVFRAGSARARELAAKRSAGAKDPHPGVAARDAGVRGVVLYWDTLHVDLLECVGVLGFEPALESEHALARYARECLVGLVVGVEL